MLTVTTPLKTFRFRVSEFKKKCGVEVHPQVIEASYGYGLEIEAMLRGEPYSGCLIRMKKNNIIGDRRVPIVDVPEYDNAFIEFNFVCSDGSFDVPYRRETLARHSLLIRDYLSDYPDSYTIELKKHKINTVKSVLVVLIGHYVSPSYLSRLTLYAAQTLNPPNDLYYLFFPPQSSINKDFILSIIKNITIEERENILEYHQLQVEYQLGSHVMPLPDCGRGLAITYAISTLQWYIASNPIPELRDPYPSAVFTILSLCKLEEARRMLLEIDFNDSCTILRPDTKQYVVNAILGLSTNGSWGDFCTIMGIIGVKGDILKNEGEERLAPYQLILAKGDLSEDQWSHISNFVYNKKRDELDKVGKLFMPFK